MRDDEAGELRVVAEYANEDGGQPFAFTPDGSRLWVGSARGSDLLRLVELDPADGSEREIDRDDEVDLAGPMVSDRTGELLGAVYLRDRVVLHAFDERLARDWEARARAAPRRPAHHRAGRRGDRAGSSPSTTTATRVPPSSTTARPARPSSSTARGRGSTRRPWPRWRR